MRNRVIWLASYPKTGNTWLKEIINLILSPDAAAIRSIPTLHKNVIPDAPSHNFGSASTKIIKTHFHPKNKRIKWLWLRLKAVGLITIYRHPLDILLSSLNYGRIRNKPGYFIDGKIKTVEEIIECNEIEYYIDRFIKADGVPIYTDSSGNWSTFQRRWEEYAKDHSIKHLNICYERMVMNPSAVVWNLYDYFDIPCNEDSINKIILVADERTKLDGRFFWKKKAFNFRSMLSMEQIEKFCMHFSEELKRQGYNDLEPDSIV